MDEHAEKVLKTEYSAEFDQLRKNRMFNSFYKYGPVAENYGEKLVNAVASLEKYLERYKKTGNTEYLADVANFAMIEFMFPQHPQAHFRPTDSLESPGLAGMCINEIKGVGRHD